MFRAKPSVPYGPAKFSGKTLTCFAFLTGGVLPAGCVPDQRQTRIATNAIGLLLPGQQSLMPPSIRRSPLRERGAAQRWSSCLGRQQRQPHRVLCNGKSAGRRAGGGTGDKARAAPRPTAKSSFAPKGPSSPARMSRPVRLAVGPQPAVGAGGGGGGGRRFAVNAAHHARHAPAPASPRSAGCAGPPARPPRSADRTRGPRAERVAAGWR